MIYVQDQNTVNSDKLNLKDPYPIDLKRFLNNIGV